MFYIDHFDFKNQLYGIADTDDGVVDLITVEEFDKYTNQGMEILNWDRAKTQITGRMVRNCNYSLWRKLQRGCSSDELVEYLTKYSVYHISDQLNKYALCIDFSKGCKIFDYSNTSNYFIFTVYLSNGSFLAVRIDSDYNIAVCMINGIWHYEKYPSCAGNVYARLFKKFNIDTSGIIADEPYLFLYSSNNLELILLNHYSFSMNTLLIKENKLGEILS